MPTLESRQTPFRDSIDKRQADLLVGLERNTDLRELLNLLCFVLAHNLEAAGVPRHLIAEDPYWQNAFEAMRHGCERAWGPVPGLNKEPLKWESILLDHLCKQIQTHASELFHVFDQHLPEALRRYAFVRLEDSASSVELKTRLRDHACRSIPHAWLRLPGNPVKIYRDPTTGQLDLEDAHLASSENLLEIASLNNIYTEPRSAGRRKRQPKPKGSGRATIKDEDALSAFNAKQFAKPYQSPPWWCVFHRNLGKQLPSDPKQQDALRKKYDDWARKGERITVQRKKVG